MGARSRRKGSRIEREVARIFQEHLGGTWSRVPLSGGWANRAEFATCGDVITTLKDFPFTVECKAVEGWHVEQLLTSPERCPIVDWWRQAVAQAQDAGKKPLLVFTRNFQPLFAVARTADGAHGRGLSAMLDGERVEIALLSDLLAKLQPVECACPTATSR